VNGKRTSLVVPSRDELRKISLFDRKGWKTVRFGEVVENVNETERVPAEAGIGRFIGLEHLEPGSLHIREWGNVADGTTFTRRCRPGQVLFGKRRAYQRKVAIAEFDAVVSGDIYVLAPKGDRLLPKLLPFICLSERFFQHAVGTSAGSLSPRTNWSSLANFEFALPPLDQQRRIADILWAVDEVSQKYRDLALSVNALHDIFIVDLVAQTRRDPQSRLADYMAVEYGDSLPESKRSGSGFPVMGSNGTVGFHQAFTIEAPAIIIGRKGGAGEVTWSDIHCWPIDTAYYVRIINSKIQPRWLYYLLKGLKLHKYAITTSIPGLNRNDVLSIAVTIPKLEKQQEIANKLDELQRNLSTLSEHMQRVEDVKTCLSNQLILHD